jgi:hypothetical protein
MKRKAKKQQPTAEQVRAAFQSVAEACGSDILQCCVDCGEEPVIDRDGLIDYLAIHGGEHGQAVFDWILSLPGDMDDVERALDAMKVPRTWI